MNTKSLFTMLVFFAILFACNRTSTNGNKEKNLTSNDTLQPNIDDLPDGEYKNMVRYGKALMEQTAYYLGPEGVVGKHLGNKMNCTNCHQQAGAKNYSFSLVNSHIEYPQYRPREDKVLTLADRVNNCIIRPHNGVPIDYDSKEMRAFLSYFKFLYDWGQKNNIKHKKVIDIELTNEASDYSEGEKLYKQHCANCHQTNGQGLMKTDSSEYEYPPLWGEFAYQPGSSMHRVIKLAQWLKANMPHLIANAEKPFLTDKQALDIAAFINNDSLHKRPSPSSYDYPNIYTKPIDYGKGPYADSFSEYQHKYGPFKPIIEYWKANGMKPVY